MTEPKTSPGARQPAAPPSAGGPSGAAETARDIAGQQGWTGTTLLGVVLDYIGNQDSDDAFRDYLLERAEDDPLMTRVYLTDYQGIGAFPSSCTVCGDDVDLHEWWDIDGDGEMTACDRGPEPGRAAPQRVMRAALVTTLDRAAFDGQHPVAAELLEAALGNSMARLLADRIAEGGRRSQVFRTLLAYAEFGRMPAEQSSAVFEDLWAAVQPASPGDTAAFVRGWARGKGWVAVDGRDIRAGQPG